MENIRLIMWEDFYKNRNKIKEYAFDLVLKVGREREGANICCMYSLVTELNVSW